MAAMLKAVVIVAGVAVLLGGLFRQAAGAGTFKERLLERCTNHGEGLRRVSGARSRSGISLPTGVRLWRDVSCGPETLQRFDVYGPEQVHGAPVIFMVHEGG